VDSSQEVPLRGPRERAEEATSLLGHAVFGEAVTSLRRSILEGILAAPAGSEEVVKLHHKAKLLDELVGELKAMTVQVRMMRKQRQERGGYGGIR
jgi:hypothetical protein